MWPCCSLRSLDDKFNLDRVVGPVDSRCHGCRCCWVASFRIRPPQPWSLLAHTHSRRQVHTPSFLLDLSFIQSFVCVTVCVGACGRHTKDAGDEAGPRGRQGTGWEELPLRCPAPHTLALLRDTSTGCRGRGHAALPHPTPGSLGKPRVWAGRGDTWRAGQGGEAESEGGCRGGRGGGELCVGPEWDGECTPDQDGRPAGSQEGRPGLFPKSTPSSTGSCIFCKAPLLAPRPRVSGPGRPQHAGGRCREGKSWPGRLPCVLMGEGLAGGLDGPAGRGPGRMARTQQEMGPRC